MSIWLIYASYIAAVNPARLRPVLPEHEGRVDRAALATGVALAAAIGSLIVAFSTSWLDALEITPETWRIAAGMIATVVGLRILAFAGRAKEPELAGRWSALVPVAFPLLITPELVAFVSIYGATEPATTSIGGMVAALVLGVAVGKFSYRRPGVWSAGARLFAAVLVLAGLAMVVEGIRDV